MTQISDIEIILIKPQNGLIGFASLVINNAIYLSSIGIHTKRASTGYRLTYPTKASGSKNYNLFHPINQETSDAIESAITAKVKEVIEGCNNDRHHSTLTAS